MLPLLGSKLRLRNPVTVAPGHACGASAATTTGTPWFCSYTAFVDIANLAVAESTCFAEKWW